MMTDRLRIARQLDEPFGDPARTATRANTSGLSPPRIRGRLDPGSRLRHDQTREGEQMGTTDTTLLPFAGAVAEAKNGLDRLYRSAGEARARYERAGDAGANLAREVYRFIMDPEAVGTDTLREAYDRFMEQHSAGFCA